MNNSTINRDKKEESGFIRFADDLAKTSESFAFGWPDRLKPIAKTFFIILMSLVFIIVYPFSIIYRPIFDKKNKNKDIAFNNLFKYLEEQWYEKSDSEAINTLTEIHSKLFEVPTTQPNNWKILIEPFGLFYWPKHYIKISNALYLWEIERGNWVHADEICEKYLSIFKISDKGYPPGCEEWITRKAKCIKNLSGKIKAEEYLLKFLNPEKTDSIMNKYLYELRNEK